MFTDLGVQTQVNATDAQNEFLLDTVKRSNGTVHAVYSSSPTLNSDGPFTNFLVRELDAAGAPSGSEVTLAVPASGFSGGVIDRVEVTVLNDGRFLLVYTDALAGANPFTPPVQSAIRFQIYSASGAASGPVQTIGTSANGQGVFFIEMAANPNGGFDVVTQNFSGGALGTSIYPVSAAAAIGAPAALSSGFVTAEIAGYINGAAVIMGTGSLATQAGIVNGFLVDFPGANPPVGLTFPAVTGANQSYAVFERRASIESATSVVVAFERLLFQNPTGPGAPPTILDRVIQIVRFTENQPPAVLSTIGLSASSFDDASLSDFKLLSDGTFALALETVNPATSLPSSELRHYGSDGQQLGAAEALNPGGSAAGGVRLEQLANGTIVATYTGITPGTGADTEVFRETFTVPGPSTTPTPGNDSITGTSGNDAIDGLAGNDTIRGGDGDDTLTGGAGNDSLFGDNGNDTINFGFGDTALGGDGNDLLILTGPYSNDMSFGGGAGFDTLDAQGAGIGLNGTGGTGIVFISTERALGTAFNDYFRVQDDVSATVGKQFFGNGGNDTMVGGSLNDSLNGGTGSDTLVGNAGGDTLEGGTGADILDGGAGADVLDGGADFDFAYYITASGGVTARLDFASLNSGDAAGDTYVSVEGLVGSAFNDFLVGDDVLGNYLTAQGGDDYIAGRGGDDTIRGDDGNDQFWGGEGADALDGGAGYDIARYDFAGSGIVVWLGGGTNTGEAAGDTFTGIEALYGSAFRDFLIGDNAANVLVGLDGDDYLYGLSGNDLLLGGAGIDAFAFNTAGFGTDTVLDFATTTAAGASHDIIDFRGLTFSSFAITQSGADALVTTNHGTVILQGVSASTLVFGDFLF
jgi:Ca2+-binding RTX toxin-like protein